MSMTLSHITRRLITWLTVFVVVSGMSVAFPLKGAATTTSYFFVGWLNNWDKNDKSLPLTLLDDGETWEISVKPTNTDDGNHGWFKIAPSTAYGQDNFWDQLYCAPYNGYPAYESDASTSTVFEGDMVYGNEGAWKLPRDRETTAYTIRINPTTMRFQIVVHKEEYQPYSTTLPVLFINTDHPVDSKETYVNGSYYVETFGLDGYQPIGSRDNPLPLQIKGRGNYTWDSFSKKPYRLKLQEKVALLGMKSNRHFTLLAHADDDLAFLRNTVGFELSRVLGLDYTPEQEPVEVVLNGDYIGLYMLTDKIRVGKQRVNITEQDDYETDAYNITGGWLIEIDNYDDQPQVTITESDGQKLRATVHSPENLSSQQTQYLRDLLVATDKAIYKTDKSSTQWEQYIDIDALARYYLVQEIMDDAESFHGSCYIHKERGNDTKLVFGPVWDFGNAYRRSYHHFIYDNPPFGQNWIGEIARYPRFQEHVRRLWHQYFNHYQQEVFNAIEQFIAQIASAAVNDGQRWPQYSQADTQQRKEEFIHRLKSKTEFLRQQWGEQDSGIVTTFSPFALYDSENPSSTSPSRSNVSWYTIDGRQLSSPHSSPFNSNSPRPGLYIKKGKKTIRR